MRTDFLTSVGGGLGVGMDCKCARSAFGGCSKNAASSRRRVSCDNGCMPFIPHRAVGTNTGCDFFFSGDG